MTDTLDLLTLREAAQRLRVSVRTLEREAADGRLAILRIRSRRMVTAAELDRYLAAQTDLACRYDARATAGKSASVQAAARALSNAFRRAPPATTRSRSKLKSAAPKWTPRLVESDG